MKYDIHGHRDLLQKILENATGKRSTKPLPPVNPDANGLHLATKLLLSVNKFAIGCRALEEKPVSEKVIQTSRVLEESELKHIVTVNGLSPLHSMIMQVLQESLAGLPKLVDVDRKVEEYDNIGLRSYLWHEVILPPGSMQHDLDGLNDRIRGIYEDYGWTHVGIKKQPWRQMPTAGENAAPFQLCIPPSLASSLILTWWVNDLLAEVRKQVKAAKRDGKNHWYRA